MSHAIVALPLGAVYVKLTFLEGERRSGLIDYLCLGYCTMEQAAVELEATMVV